MISVLLTIFFVGVVTAICPHEESGLLGWSTPAAWNDGQVCNPPYVVLVFNMFHLLSHQSI